jgi:hypothetical protein
MCYPPGVSFAVYKLPENQLGAELAGFDQLLHQIVVGRRLLRARKAGPHADGLGTECRHCNEASAIADRPHAIIGTSSSSTARDNKTRDPIPSLPECPSASKSSMPTAAQHTFMDKTLFFGLRICERHAGVNSIVYAACSHGYLGILLFKCQYVTNVLCAWAKTSRKPWQKPLKMKGIRLSGPQSAEADGNIFI